MNTDATTKRQQLQMSAFTTLVARGVRQTNKDMAVFFEGWQWNMRANGVPDDELTWANFNNYEKDEDGLGLGDRLRAQLTRQWKDEIQHIHAEASELSAELQGKPRSWVITIRGKPSLTLTDLVKVANKLLNSKRTVDVTLAFEQTGTTETTIGTGAHFHAVASFPRTLNKGKIIDIFLNTTGFLAQLRDHIEPSGVHVEEARNPQRFIDEYMGNHVSADGHKEVTAEWDDRWRTGNGLAQYYRKGQTVILGTSTTPRITFPI